MANSMAELIVNRLRQDDEITEAVGPHELVRYWPPAVTAWSTKAARDAFFSSPTLPRLLDPNAIRRTIVDGVAQKILAYVGPNVDGRYDPFHFGTTLAESDVEISEDMYLLTADEARKHVEPPRLERLVVTPPSVRVKPGEQVRFSVEGLDQHGRPFAVEGPIWTVTTGTIDPNGSYSTPNEPGVCVDELLHQGAVPLRHNAGSEAPGALRASRGWQRDRREARGDPHGAPRAGAGREPRPGLSEQSHCRLAKAGTSIARIVRRTQGANMPEDAPLRSLVTFGPFGQLWSSSGRHPAAGESSPSGKDRLPLLRQAVRRPYTAWVMRCLKADGWTPNAATGREYAHY